MNNEFFMSNEMMELSNGFSLLESRLMAFLLSHFSITKPNTTTFSTSSYDFRSSMKAYKINSQYTNKDIWNALSNILQSGIIDNASSDDNGATFTFTINSRFVPFHELQTV